jgi:hypothetical protein
MKIIFAILVLATAAQASFYKPPQPDKYEGDKPYTPTRLEWLTAINQNECGAWLNGIPTVAWGLFNVNGTKDTITVIVHFTDEAVRTQAQQAAETCERNIRATTKDRGWTWIKTALQVGNRDVSKNPSGFKMVSLEKGSVYEKLGLKQGDVIKTINGKPVNSPKDAMELTNLLKSADKVEIELVRDGSTQKMTYQIK